MKNLFASIFSVIVLFSVGTAFAESASNIKQGTVEHQDSSSSTARFLEQTYFNYFAIFHGPQAANLESPNAVDRRGNINPKMGMYFDSEVTAAYMFTKSVGAGFVAPFLFSPVLGQGMTLGDLGVKVFDKKAISTSHLNISANLILQAPTSKLSRSREQDFGIKTTPAIRYSIPSSRFTVGSWNEAKAYLGVNDKALDKKTFKLFAAPYVNYQLSPDFSLNVQYAIEAHHYAGKQGIDFQMYQTDIEPGFIYMLTNKIMINPYAQIFTGNNVSDKVALGAVISATL